jgi:hypothetical protein
LEASLANSSQDPISKKKKKSQKKAGGVAQGVGLEFKPQYHKKKKSPCRICHALSYSLGYRNTYGELRIHVLKMTQPL